MSNGIIVDTNYFDGVDLEKPSIKHPIFEKMQANARALAQSNSQNDDKSLIEPDVWQLIRQHNTPQEIIRLNAVIRALYSTA